MSEPQWKVGIDLAPAGRQKTAPGTARHVAGQARALFALDVPWKWVPVFSAAPNPLREEVAHLSPLETPFKRASLHSTLGVSRRWQQTSCDLGFCTAYFTPIGGPPVVANFFDSNFVENIDAWHREKKRAQYLVTRTLMLRSIQRAQALFIDSEYCRNQIARHLPHQAHKFIVAPCGIKQPGPPGAKPPSWATPSDRPFFLYVGSFSDNKNQRTLLAAWHLFQTKYPDAPRLVLIGPGRGQYMDEVIHPLHRALPRPEEVILPGFTAEEDLNWAFWNATAYLQPSIAEGFGLPVIEAMSCGLPVACSDSTSLPEVAGGNALLFNPHSPNSILEAIEKLWQDQALRAQMAEAGRIHATRYTWEKNAKIVADAIHSQLTKTRNE